MALTQAELDQINVGDLVTLSWEHDGGTATISGPVLDTGDTNSQFGMHGKSVAGVALSADIPFTLLDHTPAPPAWAGVKVITADTDAGNLVLVLATPASPFHWYHVDPSGSTTAYRDSDLSNVEVILP